MYSQNYSLNSQLKIWMITLLVMIVLIILVGGLTRLTDKRKVRKDIADIFCTNADGVRGKKALDWNLVDHIAPPSKFNSLIDERVSFLESKVKKLKISSSLAFPVINISKAVLLSSKVKSCLFLSFSKI